LWSGPRREPDDDQPRRPASEGRVDGSERRGFGRNDPDLEPHCGRGNWHYEGGAIIAGVLVGRVDTAGGLRFCYAQTDRDGRIDGGISAAVLDRMPDGRIRLTEMFQWFTRDERGTNVFEELSPAASV
jgi:hypothetical protein